jgi:hypothetical protein
MNIGDEVEVQKKDDPNDGRAGHVARMPAPNVIDVAFEGGMEKATYKPEELRRVPVRVPPGMQSEARGEQIKMLLFWQHIPEHVRDSLLTCGDPAALAVKLRSWADGNERIARALRAMAGEMDV